MLEFKTKNGFFNESNPLLIAEIGQAHEGSEGLAHSFIDALSDINCKAIKFQIQAVENPDVHAQVLASLVVQQLETRVPFRRAVREVIRKAEFAGVRGIKIQVSGRLNGAEIARSEWVRKGRVPLHTLRAKIDYALCTAKTIYGILGVKVWVYQP